MYEGSILFVDKGLYLSDPACFCRTELFLFFLYFQDELQKDKPPPAESEMGIEVSPYKIGRKEVSTCRKHIPFYLC